MNRIPVCASKQYDVCVGCDLLSNVGTMIPKKTNKVAIISDSNVWPLYGNTVANSLTESGLTVCRFVFPAGEASKNGQTYLEILNFLAENQLTRSDMLIALGGGVVGDMTGFAAATYLRGISFVQIPTTLLAMVDSSVGGKTAIDLPAGKNLAGAFYQPDLVICDISALDTLPELIFIDGCAEVIKYGILYDASLFAHLEENGMDFDRMLVITHCIELKRDVVSADEFDAGARQKLNLGHTIGHGIEKSSNFAISHGQAVAAGTAIITKAASAYEICDDAVYQRIISLLSLFKLPTTTGFSANELFCSALSDKKRTGNFVNIIVPHQIGDCQIHKTSICELEQFIKAGL